MEIASVLAESIILKTDQFKWPKSDLKQTYLYHMFPIRD